MEWHKVTGRSQKVNRSLPYPLKEYSGDPALIAAAEAAGRLTPADQKFLKLLEPAPTGAAEGVS